MFNHVFWTCTQCVSSLANHLRDKMKKEHSDLEALVTFLLGLSPSK